MLSNTATPKYYGAFRKKVLAGEIPVCRELSLYMNIIDDRIDNPEFYYDDQAVEGWVRFCENEMCLTDGRPLKLLDSFKLWGEDLFGWYYFEERSVYVASPNNHGGHYEKRRIKHRLIRVQYLIVGRGAAKSLYASCIQAYLLACDTSTSHQITVAPTKDLAQEVITPIQTALARSRGPLFKFMTEGSLQNTTGDPSKRKKMSSTKKGIENFITNSILEVRPMAIDKLQSMRILCGTVDEWLSSDIRENCIEALEQSCEKGETADRYMIICTSSEGTVRNGPGDDIKMTLTKILDPREDYMDFHTSIFWYKLDDVKEVADESMWMKANPNIGTTVTYETYERERDKAEHDPTLRNDILAKRFGIPEEGYTYYFTYDEIQTHKHREYWQMECSLGADLSQGGDFCAFTFLFPLANECFGIKTRSYISSLTLSKLPPAMRSKYDDFINEGSLIVMEGTVLDMMEIYDDLDEYIEHCQYDVRTFGYDPYNAKEFVNRWESENGPFGIEKVRQGRQTESVPLTELKTLASERMLLFDEQLMKFTMGNCIVSVDNNGNKFLMKLKYEAKIDNVSALMDAYVAYKNNRDAFG